MADEPIAHHQYHSVLYEESQLDVSALQTSHGLSDDSANLRLCWRPFYLRRFVLLGFISVFILIIVAIETLLAISNRDQGLATSSPTKHYLWTYGPTAFLTGVAALWARTEYQTPASSTLLLDYISQFSLFAIFTSLTRRDFTVSITLTVLISLSWIDLNQSSYPMILRDRFVDNSDWSYSVGDLASYVIRGLRDQDLALPEGISSDYAFQSVQTGLPDTAETNVTPANVVLAGFPPSDTDYTSPQCASSDDFLPIYPIVDHSSLSGFSTLFARFGRAQCDEISGELGARIIVVFGNLTYRTDYSTEISVPTFGTVNPIVAPLTKSTNLLCIAEYNIDRVQVIRNNTLTRSVKPIQGAHRRTLESITAWDIFRAHELAGLTTQWNGGQNQTSINISGVPIDVDPYMYNVLYSKHEPELQAMDIFNFDILQNITEYYYRQASAVIAKQSLMEPIRTDTVGSATMNEARLIVSFWIAQWMVALVAVCIIITVIALFTVPSKGFLPYSPTTFSGLISILFQSRQLLTQLRCAGASDNEHFVQFLRRSTFQSRLIYDPLSNQNQFSVIDIDCDDNGKFNRCPQISSKVSYPIVLHPACRSAICLSVISLIVALELLLLKSDLEHGLGNANDNTYLYHTWTAVPALLLGLLSMAFSAVDSQIRTLAPYIALKQFVSRDTFKQFELLDMTVPTAIYREIRLRSFWALPTTTAILIASLFTIFSASVFQELSIPTKTPISTHEVGNLSSIREVTTLILASNYSFPRFTYMDLSFPEFTAVTTLLPNSTLSESAFSVSAVIPAVRGKMDCNFYAPDKIRVDFRTRCYDLPPYKCGRLFDVWIDGHGNPEKPDTYDLEDNTTYIASLDEATHQFPQRNALFFWAKINSGANPTLQHAAALSCNLTSEILDVNTTFIGTNFDVDSRNPPQPLEATVRDANISEPIADDFGNLNDLVQIGVGLQALDRFFSLLVTSPWAIPLSALGDPSMNDDVIAAIRLHRTIIMAQRVRGLLVPANETNVTLVGPISPGDNDAQRMVNGTVTNTTGRRRIVQDAASTHILVALLATTLTLFVIGWVTAPSTDVLPRNPTTIASIVALLAGGNIFDRLPKNRPFLSPEEIACALGGPETQFWMGWGNLKDEEGIEYGGENEGGVSQFGIFVVDEEEVHQI
ncbi:hypothetical protein F4680DRAFT_471456 [Xylaria scruposa]|nr:hypothetical protein F4680DRAFT_471456 [Xylaria scruposa]